MLRRCGFLLVLLALLGGAAIVLLGEMDEAVSLTSVFEIWADVLRDADQFGLKLTRVTDEEEMALGKEVVHYFPRHENREWDAYVTAVGHTLTHHVHRPGIRYEFHVLDWPEINAFALPGGQIFITTGMLDFLKSEAELAAILGHEMAHVDQRHCIERFQYQLAMRKVGRPGVGVLADYLRQISAAGYSKHQELEADTQGVALCIQAGYYPMAAAEVFDRFREKFREQEREAPKQPLQEVTLVVADALGSYLDSHPPSEERSRRLRQLVNAHRRYLTSRTFYEGIENYQRRVPRTEQILSSSSSRGESIRHPEGALRRLSSVPHVADESKSSAYMRGNLLKG